MGSNSLAGKPIVITGASSGIGRATALACAAAGMPVVVSARRSDRLHALVEEIRGSGGKAAAFTCDVRDPESCRSLIVSAIDAFGPLHAVFANAGYGLEASVQNTSDEALRALFETNFFGTINTIRPALPHLIEQKRGHILICSSCLARIPIPFYAAYCATKAAQHHIGRALQIELEEHHVHVTTVHPLGTRTEFFDRVRDHTASEPLFEHSHGSFMQDASFVAGKIVRCLRRPHSEIWPGFSGAFVRWSVGITTAVPALANFGMRNELKRRAKLRGKRPK